MPPVQRNKKLLSDVQGSSTNITDMPALPNGKRLHLKMVGGADINLGDNKSSVYIVQWGTVGAFEDVCVLSLTGTTYENFIDEEFVGDGSKFIRILRVNNSLTTKRLPFWLKAISN